MFEKSKYNGIIVEVTKDLKSNGSPFIRRYTLTDEHSSLDIVLKSNNFCLMSPISYIGKNRVSENARVLYSLTIDLDGIIIKNGNDPFGLRTLIHQINDIHRLPNPTFIVSSGTGLHLYYVFDKPIILFKNVVKQLQVYKRELTRLLWQGYITELEDNIQYESLFQGFRVVGTVTKMGDRARAFKTGERINIDYLNQFVDDKYKLKDFSYKSNMTLLQAKENYPEWYQNRIVDNKPKGHWTCSRDVYNWWIKKLYKHAKTGHRYYCLMVLSIYAKKCDIPYTELEHDAFKIMKFLDSLPADENNPFNESDVLDALEAYNDRYITYPINSISYLTDIPIEKNKRNYRKQEAHLYLARRKKEDMKVLGEIVNEGRPSKEHIVKEWQNNNPTGRKIDCIRETGLSKPTVYKYWNLIK